MHRGEYQRETPPMPAEARARLAELPTVELPMKPAIYFLWDEDRVVFIGKATRGWNSPTLMTHHKENARLGSLVKEEPRRQTLQPCPEELHDLAVKALIWYLRPKHNRLPKRVDERTQAAYLQVLRYLGYAVDRAA